MNKKKLYFLITFITLIISIIFVTIFLGKDSNKNNNDDNSDIVIWILGDKEKFENFLSEFSDDTDNNMKIKVESFSNYEEYNMALSSAIIKGEAPDIFMLNNNEKSFFLEQAIGLDPNELSPDDLRKYFYSFFLDDLIYSSGEKDKEVEFLVGVPFGFETLGLYFNLARVNDVNKMKSFPEIEQLISDFHERKPDLVALGIGRGTTVKYSYDIITQFLMSEGVSNYNNINNSNIKKAFSEYFIYNTGDNSYEKFHELMKKQNKTNIDYFVDGDIAMIFGYPRMIEYIDKLGFSKRTLRVTNFPEFINTSNNLVNYNYFVLNKDSKSMGGAYSLLKYILSEQGQKKLLKEYKYYLPARIALLNEFKDLKISDNFHVKLGDFYNSEAIYSSFDKGLKNMYDDRITELLDNDDNYLFYVGRFISSLICKTDKILHLNNLDKKCE